MFKKAHDKVQKTSSFSNLGRKLDSRGSLLDVTSSLAFTGCVTSPICASVSSSGNGREMPLSQDSGKPVMT